MCDYGRWNEITEKVGTREAVDYGEGELKLGRDVGDDRKEVDESLHNAIKYRNNARDHEGRGSP